MTVNWTHPQACQIPVDPVNPGNKKGISFGSVMLIIIACLVVLYFLIGIPVMHFGFKKSGIEMIPFINFWTSLPGLVIEGVKGIFCCTLCRGGGYEQIA